jgi:hypothetical protein
VPPLYLCVGGIILKNADANHRPHSRFIDIISLTELTSGILFKNTINMKNPLILSVVIVLLLASSEAFAQCYSDQSNSYWRIGSPFSSFKISDCNPAYNCHGFTMSYFQGSPQCQPTDFSFISPAYSCPNQSQGGVKGTEWKTNNRYVQVCEEAHAKIAYYEGVGMSGGHSAVKVSGGTTPRYISKYGADGPLVSHRLNESWYHYDNNGSNRVTSTEFWTFFGDIQGTSSITGTGSQAYNVLSEPGLSYSWSIISGGENIYISSGSSSNSVTLSPLHSGNAVLRVTVSSGCGLAVSQTKNLSIQTNICLEGTFQNNSSTVKNLMSGNSVSAGWVQCTVTCPNAATYTWQRTSGTISYYSSGNFLSFNITSGSSVSFSVTARNSSNVVLATRNISFYNFGSFAAFPNPASSTFTIDALDDASMTLAITNLNGKPVKEIRNHKGKADVDITNLKDGDYILSTYMEGKLMKQQRIKIKH